LVFGAIAGFVLGFVGAMAGVSNETIQLAAGILGGIKLWERDLDELNQ